MLFTLTANQLNFTRTLLQAIKTWSDDKRKSKTSSSLIETVGRRLKKTFTPRMLLLWALYLLLFWYVQKSSKPLEVFDPFKILGVSEDATEADIKKAYRRLSLQYHPDKNPDPEATAYFAEYITKAYKALTDEVARENYQKYGHPDGKQAVSLSVALPEWFFNKDKEAAPAILLTLLLGGIVLPLGLAAWYMGRSQRYVGPNEVLQETIMIYSHDKLGVKQKQGVARLLETLVMAKEFRELSLTSDQAAALRELRPSLTRCYAELQEKPKDFYEKRHPKLVKVHMLLLAHMARLEIPSSLRKDAAFVLKKTPRLLQELYAASLRSVFRGPRIRPHYGWLAPACGTIELMQCLVQAVSPEERKKAGHPGRSGEGAAALLQLPHFTEDAVRALNKKKVRSLSELRAFGKEERRNTLQSVGLSGAEAADVEIALEAMPSLAVAARLEVRDDSGSVMEEAWAYSDVVTVTVWTLLSRASHQAPGFDPESIQGKAVRAFAPRYPYPREEHWFLLVADPATGALLAWKRASLIEAEAAGARYAAGFVGKATASKESSPGSGAENGDVATAPTLKNEAITGGGKKNNGVVASSGADPFDDVELLERIGQQEELQFLAPDVGKHDLMLYVMPDSWLGADRAISIGRLKTVEPTRAQREGRAERARAKPSAPAPGGRRQPKGDRRTMAEGSKEKTADAEGRGIEEDDEDAARGEGKDGGWSAKDGENHDEEDVEEEDFDDDDDDEGEPEWDSDEYGTEETASERDEEEESVVDEA